MITFLQYCDIEVGIIPNDKHNPYFNIVIAVVIFLLVKTMNRLVEKKEEENKEESTTKKCPYCREEILKEATRCPRYTSRLEE